MWPPWDAEDREYSCLSEADLGDEGADGVDVLPYLNARLGITLRPPLRCWSIEYPASWCGKNKGSDGYFRFICEQG
jgi:hypothetical protein